MGISAAMITAIAASASAAAAAAGTAFTVKKGIAQKGEASSAKGKAELEARKNKDLLAKTKVKTPATRLLGGKPSLG
jgi:hypothetical protein